MYFAFLDLHRERTVRTSNISHKQFPNMFLFNSIAFKVLESIQFLLYLVNSGCVIPPPPHTYDHIQQIRSLISKKCIYECNKLTYHEYHYCSKSSLQQNIFIANYFYYHYSKLIDIANYYVMSIIFKVVFNVLFRTSQYPERRFDIIIHIIIMQKLVSFC